MSEAFDPYRKWLGIPPQHQPPHHYRLLGIEAFESDPDVIANAADGRMAQVKTFQTGKNSEASQRILNELAAAKVCLLNPEKKADYDRRLREAIRAEQAAQSPAPPMPTAAHTRQPFPTALPPPEPDVYSLVQSAPPPPFVPPVDAIEQMVGPAAQPLSPDGGEFVDYESPSFAGSSGAAAGRSPAKKRIVKKSQSQNWQIPAVVIGVGLLLVVGLVMMALNQKDEEEKQQKKVEEAHKAQVEEERIIPYHVPKPKPSPSHAERPPRDSDLPASKVATRPKRPRSRRLAGGNPIRTTSR